MNRKALAFAIILNIFFSDLAANSLVTTNNLSKRKFGNSPVLLKGTVRKVVRKGEKINIHPETIFNSEMTMAGDYFSAFITETDAQKLGVPFGSKLIGEVKKSKQAKSFHRDGDLEVHVGHLMLPDGDMVAVDANFESVNQAPVKHVTKALAKEVTTVGASALVGAKDALSYTGIHTAIATHGISVGIGAGLGLGLGLLGAIGKDGEIASTNFGTSTLKLKDDFVFLEELPIMAQNLKILSPETYGIDIDVKDIRKLFSAEFGDFLLFDVDLKNNTPKDLFLSDFVLVSKKHIIPLLTNPLISNVEAFDSIKTNHQESCQLAFSLAKVDKKENYKLQLIDPVSEKILVDFKVDFGKYI